MADPRVIVIGAGPAGVRCAQTLVAAGIRPTVIEEGRRDGGQIYRRQPESFTRSYDTLYGDTAGRAKSLHDDFDVLTSQIDYRPETLAWNVVNSTVYAVKAGVSTPLPFDALVVCAGATDRLMPIPGWDFAGTYSLGGAQIALKAQACSIGRQVVFMGTGPLLYLVAAQYVAAGAKVAAVLDTSPFSLRIGALPKLLAQPAALFKGMGLVAALKRARVPMYSGVTLIEITGDAHDGVSGVVFENKGVRHTVHCDAVGFGYHLRPETQLADLARCEFEFHADRRLWMPKVDGMGRSSVKGVYLAGDSARVLGADAAEASGRLAAFAVLQDHGRPVAAEPMQVAEATLARIRRFQAGLNQSFPWPHAQAAALPDHAVVCRCENVTAGELRHVVKDMGAQEANRAKAFSRVGMGRCQGRYCGVAGAEIIAQAAGVPVELVGRLRGQAPIKPMTISVADPGMSALLHAPDQPRHDADVVIVGGGFMGAATAFFLRQRGRSVILLERGLVGQQASGVNFGNVRRQGRLLSQLPLANRSRGIWGRLPELLGEDAEFLPSGHVRVCYDPAFLAVYEQYAKDARPLGLDLEMLSQQQLRKRFPFLSHDVVGGSYAPIDGHANPRLAAPAFARAAVRAGAKVIENTDIAAVEKDGEDFRATATDGRIFRAPVMLITAGAWGSLLSEQFGEAVPIVARGPQMSVTEPLPYRMREVFGMSTRVEREGIYFRQVKRGNIVIGGSTRGPAFPDIRRAYTVPTSTLSQLAEMRRLVPAFARLNIIRTWSGIEGYMPDERPIMGPSGKVSGLFYAFGFSGEGFQLGPGVGDVMAELIDTGSTTTPIDDFNMARFGAPVAVTEGNHE